MSIVDDTLMACDKLLAEMPRSERAGWLKRQVGIWQRHYDKFLFTEGESTKADVTAFDYLGLIAELDKRYHKIKAEVVS